MDIVGAVVPAGIGMLNVLGCVVGAVAVLGSGTKCPKVGCWFSLVEIYKALGATAVLVGTND